MEQHQGLVYHTASSVLPDFQTTKRNVLRKVATIFDPLGFVCPWVIVAKILLQELWMRGYDWDDKVQMKKGYARNVCDCFTI